MRLIFKALYKKKLFQYGVLVLVLVLTVLSIQMSATVTLKNKTMIQKVDDIQAAHTNIYVEDTMNAKYSESDNDIPEYIETINERNNIDLVSSLENSYYDYGFTQDISSANNENEQVDFNGLDGIVIEGYISNKGTNQYKMVKGKSYHDLKNNEIIVNEQCAKSLNKKTGKVIGATIYAQRNHQYKIVGIYEDPSYHEDATASLNDTSVLRAEKLEFKFRGLGNYETIKKNSQFTFTHQDPESNKESEYIVQQTVHKVHLTSYSELNESTLLTLIQINASGSNYATFQPLYYQLQGDNTTQSIFKYLSYTLLVALIVSDFFVFYAFFKRKLDEDKSKLAMMMLSGVKQKNIIKAYLSEMALLMLSTITICGIIDAFAYFVLQLHKQEYMAIFFDVTPQLLAITLGLAALLFILLSVMMFIQIKHFFTNNLTRVMKEKDLTIKKPTRIAITFKGQLLQMALRDLFTNKFKFIRVVFASTFLILCMLLTFCSYQTMDKLYNEKTIGLHFDYTIGRVNEKQYRHMKQNFIKDVSVLTTENRYFMEKTGELDGIDVYKYYTATLITLYDNIQPFLTKESGVYPKPGVDADAMGNLIYYQRETLLPRKIIDKKDAIMDENASSDIHQKGLAFSYYPYNYSGYMRDDYMYIKGSINSLINNGYVAFTAMTAGKQHPIDKLVTANDMNGIGNGTVIRLKKGVSHQAFEDYLKQEKINFTSYEEILDQMHKSNQQINQNTFAVMMAVMIIMVFMFIVLTSANVMEEEIHKRNEHEFMIRTGWSQTFINKLSITKTAFMLLCACVISILLFFPLKWLYFYFLFKILGIYSIPTSGYIILLVPIVLSIVILFMTYSLNHKKSHS